MSADETVECADPFEDKTVDVTKVNLCYASTDVFTVDGEDSSTTDPSLGDLLNIDRESVTELSKVEASCTSKSSIDKE